MKMYLNVMCEYAYLYSDAKMYQIDLEQNVKNISNVIDRIKDYILRMDKWKSFHLQNVINFFLNNYYDIGNNLSLSFFFSYFSFAFIFSFFFISNV